ncbi:venom carboxylesterase-6-like [Schistocerca gregaria]|uniref:venom carboxylesterase-6-like n=1 Tax=Schistocerca gregaria TaxID=7010 RepID=UPI00211E236B|nr:venom carboxylesterase-6-like [Schistocerca gregaria]
MFDVVMSLQVMCVLLSATTAVEVYTNSGRVRGRTYSSKNGKQYAGFHGIRYAAPPLGQYRFKDPQLPESWTGVKDTIEDGEQCLQWSLKIGSVTGSEDCLFLNLFTPQISVQEHESKLPVMVWIHGGSWSSGAGTSNYYGPEFLMDRGVVFVSINYRLGPFGFFSTGDSASPGNYGLKDQVAALKWIQQNIEYFGGDSNSVTIFGHDAGGASVHYHMLSSLSKGLFHAAISQSGTALCPWASSQEPTLYANKLGSLVGCSWTSTAELVQCLRKKEGRVIIEADRQFLEWGAEEGTAFKPVVEMESNSAFLCEDPLETLQERNIEISIPWIVGITSHEGGNKAEAIFKNVDLLNDITKDFGKVAPLSLHYGQSSVHAEYVTEKLKAYYFGKLAVSNVSISALADMYTDGLFLWNVDETVRLHSLINSEPIYYYVFSYRGTRSFCGNPGKDSLDFGACHGDELQYIFSMDNRYRNENDSKMVDIITNLWTDFASFGNPNAQKRFRDEWENVASHEVEYFNISIEPHAAFGLFHERAQFWASLPLRSQHTHSYKFRDEL